MFTSWDLLRTPKFVHRKRGIATIIYPFYPQPVTLVAGYNSGSTVLLAADSAASHRGSSRILDPCTFFRQAHADGDSQVEESVLKIAPISDHELVAFAGSEASILAAIRHLKHYREVELEQRLRSVCDFCAPLAGVFQLAIARRVGNEVSLALWSSDRPNHIEPVRRGSAFAMGSGMRIQSYEHAVRYLAHVAQSVDYSVEEQLVIFSAGLQAVAGFEDPHKTKVSGMFATAALTSKQMAWLPDVSFISYSDPGPSRTANDFHVGGIVSCVVRDDSLALCTRTPVLAKELGHSSAGAYMKILVGVLEADATKWVRAHYSALCDSSRSFSSDFYAFVCSSARNVVIVQARKRQLDGRYVTSQMALDKGTFVMSESFLDLLRRSPNNEPVSIQVIRTT